MHGRSYPRACKLDVVRQGQTGAKCPSHTAQRAPGREHAIAEGLLLRWRREYEERGAEAFLPRQPSRAEALDARIAELARHCGQLSLALAATLAVGNTDMPRGSDPGPRWGRSSRWTRSNTPGNRIPARSHIAYSRTTSRPLSPARVASRPSSSTATAIRQHPSRRCNDSRRGRRTLRCGSCLAGISFSSKITPRASPRSARSWRQA